MFIIHIDHHVRDFDEWKRIFDSDPLDRAASGVRHYRVQRAVDDPTYAGVDLEFDTREEADKMLTRLHELWMRVEVLNGTTGTILELVETGSPAHVGV